VPVPDQPILNIAAYRFVPLTDPASWIDALRERCDVLDLKGTVIVAHEGINLFLAGASAAIEAFIAWLTGDPRFVDAQGEPAFTGLRVKRSWSDTQPFGRLRIKHKPEIVTMRRATVQPTASRAAAIAPECLATWLAQGHDDDGKPVVLLDTRNAFEVAHGHFEGARHLDIERFDAFPDAVDRVLDELRDQTIVTYCTGGIRCEKAALYMKEAGFTRVLQLDGGILDYFEQVGDQHWQGSCFVFDERIAVDASLANHSTEEDYPMEDGAG
jgi:UPF0176 protein